MKNNFQPKPNATISFSAHLFIFILLANLLSSCGIVIQTPMPIEIEAETNQTIALSATSESTINPPTEEATELPTASPTLEATATATEVLEVGEISTERKLEIVDRVNAFINAEGQYSDEELRKDPTWFDLDTDENKPLPLGMIGKSSAFFQGIFVDYEIINNNYHLFMGTLLRTGERAVFDYSFPGDYVDGYDWKMSGLPNFSSTSNYTKFSDLEEQNLSFDSVLGKPFTFVFFIGMSPEIMEINEIFALTGSSVCQNYMIDLFYLVHVAEREIDKYPNDNEQNALYFTSDNLLELDDFNKIKNNVLCGIGGMTIRKP